MQKVQAVVQCSSFSCAEYLYRLYEKWFKNDYVYQTLDQSAPEYVRNLWMTSAVLKNGARCDIFLDGYMVENFEKYISTINHQYFIDQIKIRKKLNLL